MVSPVQVSASACQADADRHRSISVSPYHAARLVDGTEDRADVEIRRSNRAHRRRQRRGPQPRTRRWRRAPAEVVYAERMTKAMERLRPKATEELRLAARAQHLRRWTVPRASYPMDRAGYLRWRNDLKRRHAEWAAEIMAARATARIRSLASERSSARRTSRATPRRRRSRTSPAWFPRALRGGVRGQARAGEGSRHRAQDLGQDVGGGARGGLAAAALRISSRSRRGGDSGSSPALKRGGASPAQSRSFIRAAARRSARCGRA